MPCALQFSHPPLALPRQIAHTPKMRIALAQLNPTVGDLAGNAALVAAAATKAQLLGAELLLCPELIVCGYPPRDWLERQDFLAATTAMLNDLVSKLPANLTVLLGAPESDAAGRLYNSIAALSAENLQWVARKQLLPSDDVFDETRYFQAGEQSRVIKINGLSFGLTICEDIWAQPVNTAPCTRRSYSFDPIAALDKTPLAAVCNFSASPMTLNKGQERGAKLEQLAIRLAAPVLYVNQVGGNDGLIFDGNSQVRDATGQRCAVAPSFVPALIAVDLAASDTGSSQVRVVQSAEIVAEKPITVSANHAQAPEKPRPVSLSNNFRQLPVNVGQLPEHSEAAVALTALSLGVRDYVRKSGFKGVLLGLSGGIDSALTAAIAARALGPAAVLGVAMPTRFSSTGSLQDAEALANALNISYQVLPVDPIYQCFLDTLGQGLTPAKDSGETTFENIQARIRGTTLMALSNRTGRLLLNTGNKSELAVGYCTLYGDMAGGLAVISDIYKGQVYALARELNRQAGRHLIPQSTLEKPPSAELRPGQQDSDSLPDYDTLDAIVAAYIEKQQSPNALIAAGFAPETVMRVVALIVQNEHKRHQMPPGLILSAKAFGVGRRYPLAQRWCG